MRSKLISLFFVLLTLSACSPRVREFRLGEGYAATSVNAAVFRAASVTSDSQYQFAAWYAPRRAASQNHERDIALCIQ